MAGCGWAASAPTADAALLPACGVIGAYGDEASPAEWSRGCAGGSPYFTNLAWTGWGGATAVASGNVLLNNCEPSCADGFTASYPATLVVSGLRMCSSPTGADSYYTRVDWTAELTDGNPYGEPAGTYSPGGYDLDCTTPSSKPKIFNALGGSDMGGVPKLRPREIFVGGVGSDQGFRKLKWQKWNKSSARGRGRYLVRAKPGSPQANRRLSWPVKVRLSRVRACGGQRYFTRINATFTSGRPNGFPKKQFKLKVACS